MAVSLSDFKKDQTAWLCRNRHDMRNDSVLAEVRVWSVGRKFVMVLPDEAGPLMKFELLSDRSDYLIEARDCGWKQLLFLSRQAAEDYLEKIELQTQLSLFFGDLHHVGSLGLDQLRGIKAILDESR